MSASQTLIILGANGDLASRLLLPGLGTYLSTCPRQRRVDVLGSGRHAPEDFADDVYQALTLELDEQGSQHPAVQEAAASARFITGDATDPEALAGLIEAAEGQAVLYCALAPSVAVSTVEALKGLHEQQRLPEDLVLALEKPFGTDLDSARELNGLLAGSLPEDRLVRVDHFTAMPGVHDLLGLRFRNGLLEPLWNREHVARLEIVFDETLGLEGRADFYESTGAAEDMLQSHLLQVMGLAMMDRPAGGVQPSAQSAGQHEAAPLPAGAGALLRQTRLWPGDAGADTEADTGADTVSAGDSDDGGTGAGAPVARGRYTAGAAGARQLPSYVHEEGVDPENGTETFVQAVLEVDSDRWRGVPVILRSGKALGTDVGEIVVRFRGPRDEPPAVLRRGLEETYLDLEVNSGTGLDARDPGRVTLSSDVVPSPLTAYGSVLRALLEGDRSLAVAGEAAEEGWRILAEIRQEYDSGRSPLLDYPAGSRGPVLTDGTLLSSTD